mmetsp:Transcript_20503/g.57417  ORF Transcript_20503/g.57417 Transcript_20503/m.57417 type:complete len:311 (-) Transcript_20503:598-1530(-)
MDRHSLQWARASKDAGSADLGCASTASKPTSLPRLRGSCSGWIWVPRVGATSATLKPSHMRCAPASQCRPASALMVRSRAASFRSASSSRGPEVPWVRSTQLLPATPCFLSNSAMLGGRPGAATALVRDTSSQSVRMGPRPAPCTSTRWLTFVARISPDVATQNRVLVLNSAAPDRASLVRLPSELWRLPTEAALRLENTTVMLSMLVSFTCCCIRSSHAKHRRPPTARTPTKLSASSYSASGAPKTSPSAASNTASVSVRRSRALAVDALPSEFRWRVPTRTRCCSADLSRTTIALASSKRSWSCREWT